MAAAASQRNSKRYEKFLKWKSASEKNEKAFKDSGLARPQDANKELAQRMRQLNFSEVNFPPENPRKGIINNWKPSDSMLESLEKWQCYYEYGEPKANWIRTEADFQSMMKKMCDCNEISIDLEGHSNSTLAGYVALIQIGTWLHGDFLVDAINLRKSIATDLKYIMESEAILKIIHGGANDVLWLQRDFDIYLTAAIDTQFMYEILKGVRDIGFGTLAAELRPDLKDLLTADETLSDWRLRPDFGMTRQQEVYAINDVHILLRIFDQLRFEMNVGDDSYHRLNMAFQMTKKRLLNVYKSPNLRVVPNYDRQMETEVDKLSRFKNPNTCKMAMNLSAEARESMTHLIEWRSTFAKILDEKEEQIIPSHVMLKLASDHPRTLDDVSAIVGTLPSRIEKQKIVIMKILDGRSAYMEELRTKECHNCLKSGHGPAWGCPFPKNQGNYKIWMNRPENVEFRRKQSERRVENAKKKGYSPVWE